MKNNKRSMAALRGTKVSPTSPKLYKSLGSLIKDYRQWRGLSQEHISELVGVSVRQLRNWEANRRRVRIENLHDLSEVTGIPMQVCVALNADQPLWYSLQKRSFAYSLVEAQSLNHELFRYHEKSDVNITVNSECISTDKHYKLLISCHNDIYRTTRPLRRDVLEKASAILPDLNRIIFDSWGHYVGHSIWLPLETDVYNRLKKYKKLESYLMPEKIRDIVKLREGVFLYFSSYSASLNVSHFKIMHIARYLAELDKKEKYMVAMCSPMKEAHELLSNLDMRVVAFGQQATSDVYSKLYEIELDALMRPNGPWDWLLEENKIKEKKDPTKIKESAKPAGIGSERLITFQNTLEIYSQVKKISAKSPILKDRSLSLIVDGCDQPHQRLEATSDLEIISDQTIKHTEPEKALCPNATCSLYGKKGKGNIISNGTYRKKGEKPGRRFLCKQCGKSFCYRTGTLFYDLRLPEENVLKALKLLGEGHSLNHLKEVLGVKSSTVSRWLKIASERIAETKLLLKHELNMSDENIAVLLTSLKNISIKSKTIK